MSNLSLKEIGRVKAAVRRQLPGTPGQEQEEWSVDWQTLHERALLDEECEVMLRLIGCARALDALVDSYGEHLPLHATVSAEYALRKLGEVS